MAGTLRTVTPQDAHALADIYNEYILHSTFTFEIDTISTQEMSRRITAIYNTYPYYVYEEKGQIIGFCYAHPFHERAAFKHTLETTIYLRKGNEHRGIGRLLMEKLIAECRNRGYHVLLACLSAENTVSEHFHESLGFRVCARMHETGYKFGRWIGIVDMEMIL